jgi:hypothetical protein
VIDLPTLYSKLEWRERREVREEYIRIQGGKCHYCGEPLFGPPANAVRSKHVTHRRFPPNFFKYPVHLHHCHETDLTIGAVHNHCNAVLWQYHGK